MTSVQIERTGLVAQPTQTDDLKRIHGIGPAIERHLHRASILTYAQLAAHSPSDLAELLHGYAGVSPQQIAKHDWIGQARALTAQASPSAQDDEKPPIEPPSEGQGVNPPEELSEKFETTPRQRSAIFMVQLELRTDGSVRRTVTKHARTEIGDEDIDQWLGWDPGRLVSFIEQHAQLQSLPQSAQKMLADPFARVEQELSPIHVEVERKYNFKIRAELPVGVPAAAPVNDSAPQTSTPVLPTQANTTLSGVLRISRLETAVAGRADARNTLRPGEQLLVRLMLDLNNVVAPPDTLISYRAVVYAKQIGGSRRITLAEGAGNIAMVESAEVELLGRDLASGIYRLTAIATLNIANEPEQHQLTAFLESGLVEVLNIT